MLSLGGMAVFVMLGATACGALSIVERCGQAHPRGTQGYQNCVRGEQAEAERVRQRANRQFPTMNLP
ncbi:MAG: hypothetical protein HQ495_13335 [Alphaproteobacteria bacterium]|nr:hypothetical protein [Alphaproteobacteria bacterium]